MYGLPGSRIQFGTLPATRKPGRPSALSKFLERQRDFFLVDLILLKSDTASAPARSKARTDALPVSDFAQKQTVNQARFFDLRRCSTADQSGLPEFEPFSSHGN